ncbi:CoA-binding protein [Salipiger mangrovisoli]|uniref:CoA-binding protein n=1 Tax=Salipiger mangrovisoli TaxID=2865933 RepID=A0ABR9WWJ2_9RHOB|nr:CoA-binding protein [Salipiger mangrovisoli]MBE9635659.1 CoA-binding protein [Salipiger mangrovisoli]
MSKALSRSLAPRSVAVIGPSAEIAPVIAALRRDGYPWTIRPVTEEAPTVAGIAAIARIADLPEPPDLAHVVLAGAALDKALTELAELGAGAAVLPELGAEALAGLAAPLPVFAGGLLSPAARLPLWRDIAPLEPVTRGVAVLLSDARGVARLLALRHGLPLAMVLPLAGWQGPGLAALVSALVADDRITALAIETAGPGSAEQVLALGRLAQKHGKPLIFLTPDLPSGPAAVLRRAGLSHVAETAALVEALWILHLVGPLPANALSVTVFDAGLVERAAVLAGGQGVELAPLSPLQEEALRRDLPEGRAPGNPLDASELLTHDEARIARVLAEMMAGAAVLSLGVVRRADDVAWARVQRAAARARARVGMPLALLSLNRVEMTEARAQALLADGVIPLAGLKPALAALRAVIEIGSQAPGGAPLLMPAGGGAGRARRRGAEAGAMLGLEMAAAAEGDAGLRLVLTSDVSFGYLVTLTAASGGSASGLLPLSPPACRDMASAVAGSAPQQEALVALLEVVQDRVTEAAGALAGLEIALDLGENGPALARSIELCTWIEDATTPKRSP